MRAALVVGLMFLAGVAYNIFGPEPNHTEAMAGAAISSVLLGLFFFTRHHERRSDEFETWLIRNAAEIERTGAHFESKLISPTTVLVRYQAALSFLIVTFTIPTRPYVVGEDQTFTIAATATTLSLLLGWWGIPWGPIYTVQVVGGNLRGGLRETVAERLASVSAFTASSPVR